MLKRSAYCSVGPRTEGQLEKNHRTEQVRPWIIDVNAVTYRLKRAAASTCSLAKERNVSRAAFTSSTYLSN